MTSEDEDKVWEWIARSWDIEPRSYFEENAPKSGDWTPLQMALHYIWKRDPKVVELNQQLLEAEKIIKQYRDALLYVVEKAQAICALPKK